MAAVVFNLLSKVLPPGSAELPQALWLKLTTGESTPPSESSPEAWPWVLLLLTAAALLCSNLAITRFIAKPLGRFFLGSRASRAKVEKFSQCVMEFAFYFGYLALGLAVIHDQVWLWPSTQWWTDRDPSGAGTQKASLSLEIRFFIVMYCGRYLQALFSVVFLEHKRKDFLEMVLHHVATLVVIVISYQADCVRVGCIIMVLLDFGDPPLHLAKMSKYISESRACRTAGKSKTWATVADMWFGFFAVDFTVTRIGFYSYMVWSSTVENYSVWLPGTRWPEAVVQIGGRVAVCWALLWVLLGLQVFWELTLLRAIKKVLFEGVLADNRSDTESGADTDDERQKKRN